MLTSKIDNTKYTEVEVKNSQSTGHSETSPTELLNIQLEREKESMQAIFPNFDQRLDLQTGFTQAIESIYDLEEISGSYQVLKFMGKASSRFTENLRSRLTLDIQNGTLGRAYGSLSRDVFSLNKEENSDISTRSLSLWDSYQICLRYFNSRVDEFKRKQSKKALRGEPSVPDDVIEKLKCEKLQEITQRFLNFANKVKISGGNSNVDSVQIDYTARQVAKARAKINGLRALAFGVMGAAGFVNLAGTTVVQGIRLVASQAGAERNFRAEKKDFSIREALLGFESDLKEKTRELLVVVQNLSKNDLQKLQSKIQTILAQDKMSAGMEEDLIQLALEVKKQLEIQKPENTSETTPSTMTDDYLEFLEQNLNLSSSKTKLNTLIDEQFTEQTKGSFFRVLKGLVAGTALIGATSLITDLIQNGDSSIVSKTINDLKKFIDDQIKQGTIEVSSGDLEIINRNLVLAQIEPMSSGQDSLTVDGLAVESGFSNQNEVVSASPENIKIGHQVDSNGTSVNVNGTKPNLFGVGNNTIDTAGFRGKALIDSARSQLGENASDPEVAARFLQLQFQQGSQGVLNLNDDQAIGLLKELHRAYKSENLSFEDFCTKCLNGEIPRSSAMEQVLRDELNSLSPGTPVFNEFSSRSVSGDPSKMNWVGNESEMKDIASKLTEEYKDKMSRSIGEDSPPFPFTDNQTQDSGLKGQLDQKGPNTEILNGNSWGNLMYLAFPTLGVLAAEAGKRLENFRNKGTVLTDQNKDKFRDHATRYIMGAAYGALGGSMTLAANMWLLGGGVATLPPLLISLLSRRKNFKKQRFEKAVTTYETIIEDIHTSLKEINLQVNNEDLKQKIKFLKDKLEKSTSKLQSQKFIDDLGFNKNKRDELNNQFEFLQDELSKIESKFSRISQNFEDRKTDFENYSNYFKNNLNLLEDISADQTFPPEKKIQNITEIENSFQVIQGENYYPKVIEMLNILINELDSFSDDSTLKAYINNLKTLLSGYKLKLETDYENLKTQIEVQKRHLKFLQTPEYQSFAESADVKTVDSDFESILSPEGKNKYEELMLMALNPISKFENFNNKCEELKNKEPADTYRSSGVYKGFMNFIFAKFFISQFFRLANAIENKLPEKLTTKEEIRNLMFFKEMKTKLDQLSNLGFGNGTYQVQVFNAINKVKIRFDIDNPESSVNTKTNQAIEKYFSDDDKEERKTFENEISNKIQLPFPPDHYPSIVTDHLSSEGQLLSAEPHFSSLTAVDSSSMATSRFGPSLVTDSNAPKEDYVDVEWDISDSSGDTGAFTTEFPS